MKQDKPITGRFSFTIILSIAGKRLVIGGYTVADYPLTYTILECLEHFCDGASWELDRCYYHYEGLTLTDGIVTLLRPCESYPFASIFRKARNLYQE